MNQNFLDDLRIQFQDLSVSEMEMIVAQERKKRTFKPVKEIDKNGAIQYVNKGLSTRSNAKNKVEKELNKMSLDEIKEMFSAMKAKHQEEKE